MSRAPFKSFTPEQIARAKETPLVQLVESHGVKMDKSSNNHVGCCPFHNEKSSSFTVYSNNTFHCFGCGENGDPISFLTKRQGLTFPEAVAKLIGEEGVEATPEDRARWKKDQAAAHRRRVEEQEKKDQQERCRCREIWEPCVPIGGSLGEAYYRARGVDPDVFGGFGEMRNLGFLPQATYWYVVDGKPTSLGHFPCIVAKFQNARGRPMGLHMTYLQPDGSGKLQLADPSDPTKRLPSKKMRGQAKGCAVWLSPPTPCVAITEGIENALAFMMVRPELVIAAALSLDNLSGGALDEGPPHPHPPKDKPYLRLPGSIPDPAKPGMVLPGEVRAVIVVGDNDTKDQHMGRARTELAAAKFRGMGVRCPPPLFPPEGMDFLDWINEERGQGDV